jgi:hypothetical protein
MNKTNVLVGVIAAVVVLVGAYFVLPRQVVRTVETILGANPGTDFSSPFLTYNGINHWYYSAKVNNASTTLCSFKTPGATTTVAFTSLNIYTATATALTIAVGQSSNMTATTTQIGGNYDVAASAKATIVASTTSGADQNRVVGPSQYVNWIFSAAAATPTVNAVGGKCILELIQN